MSESFNGVERRRSLRLIVDVGLLVRIEPPDREPVTEKTFTRTVNSHGALLFLAADVEIGQNIFLVNPATKNEIEAKVVRIGPAYTGLRMISVEFLKPSEEFWIEGWKK